MTTLAAGRLGLARPVADIDRGSRLVDVLLFVTAFAITFAKIRVSVAGNYVFVNDVTAPLFVLAVFARRVSLRDFALARTAAVLLAFFAAFLVVYLVGFYNLETAADRDQFAKGMAKFVIHFLLVVAAVAYLARRPRAVYWQTLAFFVAGIAANAAYGLLQLALAEVAGRNLDQLVLGPLGLYERGGVNVFGVVGGQEVYRTTALTLDPNHLAVMLVVPLMLLLPLYLRLEPGHRLRAPLAVLLAFLALVELSTLSRSGLLGIAVGLAVLALPYRHLLLRPRVLVPLGALALVVLAVVVQRSDFFRTVFEARTQTGGSSTRTHLEFYSLIRPALEEHPFFGLGLNTFSVYYEFVTGLTNYGPHSFYVALVTETGLVGAALFLVYLVYLFGRLNELRAIGRRMAFAGDRAAARVTPLAWGLAAALAGTMAANLFYLTMSMYYFFVLAILVLAAPAVFARARA
ncbi:MAG: O-antigen ligase family protein [Actinomycetota bacterium]|nr:O-antigen ligase family protein [Actinomycetota bacterium]